MKSLFSLFYRIFTKFLRFMVILNRCIHIAMKLMNGNNSLEEKDYTIITNKEEKEDD